MAIKKATKKFLKTGLKTTLETRKKSAVWKRNQDRKKGPARPAEAPAPEAPEPPVGLGLSSDGNTDEDGGLSDNESLSGSDSDSVQFSSDVELDDIVVDSEDAGSLGSESEFSSDGSESADEGASPKEASLKTAIQKHKQELAELAEKDPDFYAYLQKNDASVLDFADSDSESGDNSDGGDEDMGSVADNDDQEDHDGESPDAEEAGKDMDLDSDMGGEAPAKKTGILLDKPTLMRLLASVTESLSLRGAKKLLMAYRSATNLDENDTEDKVYPYRIESSAVFNSLLVTVLKTLPRVLDHHLAPLDSTTTPLVLGKATSPTSHANWRKVSPVVKSFLQNTVRLLTSVTDDSMLGFILKSLCDMGKYWGAFPKIARDYLKVLLNQFGGSASETILVQAFLNIRRLAISNPTFLERCLKGLYQQYLMACNTFSVHTAASVDFMLQACVEMFGLDFLVTYSLGFVYIRQLAVVLRKAVNVRGKDAIKPLTTWQYLGAIKLWAKVLTTYCDIDRVGALAATGADASNVLTHLVYPLVQISLGVIRLLPTARYFPLRLHLVKLLLSISSSTGTYIPIAPYLLELLTSSSLTAYKPSTLKPLPMAFTIKTPKVYLGTHSFASSLLEEVTHSLLEFFYIHGNQISFSEMSLPVVLGVRRFIKTAKLTGHKAKGKGKARSKVGPLKGLGALSTVLAKVEENAKHLDKLRGALDFAPKDVNQVIAFQMGLNKDSTPLGKYYASTTLVKQHLEDQMVQTQLAETPARAEEPKPSGTKPAKSKKPRAQPKEVVSDDDSMAGDVAEGEDMVEDFVLSDDE